MATYTERVRAYIQELLDRDKSLRKLPNELYLVIRGEHDDASTEAAFELKADALKMRDELNATIEGPFDRARLDTVPFYRRGEYGK